MYTLRERERERETCVYVYIYIYIYMYIYTYIYNCYLPLELPDAGGCGQLGKAPISN